MAKLPLKARSEFVTPLKRCDGGVFETRRMFHAASAALSCTRRMTRLGFVCTTESVVPARRPTPGSGEGADGKFGAGALPLFADDEPDDIIDEHAAIDTDAAMSDAVKTGAVRS